MKKKRLFALLACAPLAVLCACGGGVRSLALSANWYKGAMQKQITDIDERLEYTVTFRDEVEGNGYHASYQEGSYVTELTTTDQVEGHEGQKMYVLRTRFEISGKFLYGDHESEPFTDHTYSEVYFFGVDDHTNPLRPLKSYKHISSHAPVANPSETTLYTPYHYEYSFDYSETLDTAKYSITTLPALEGEFCPHPAENDATPSEYDIKLTGSGTYLDNEQIFFALRGLELNEAVSFRSVDPQTRLCTVLTFPSVPTSVDLNAGSEDPENTISFDILNADGTVAETVNGTVRANVATLRYSASQPGPERKLTYAALTQENNNKYRNVLLKIENPIAQSLGYMTYSLKRARFSET